MKTGVGKAVSLSENKSQSDFCHKLIRTGEIAAKIPQTLRCRRTNSAKNRLWHIFRHNSCKYLFTFKLNVMLRWTIIFLIVAIIAAIFGFGGIAAGAAGIAKILFFIFLVLFVLSLIFGRRAVD